MREHTDGKCLNIHFSWLPSYGFVKVKWKVWMLHLHPQIWGRGCTLSNCSAIKMRDPVWVPWFNLVKPAQYCCKITKCLYSYPPTTSCYWSLSCHHLFRQTYELCLDNEPHCQLAPEVTLHQSVCTHAMENSFVSMSLPARPVLPMHWSFPATNCLSSCHHSFRIIMLSVPA